MKNHLPDGKPDCRVSRVSIDSVDFEFAGNIEFQEVEPYTSPACLEKIYRACAYPSQYRGLWRVHRTCKLYHREAFQNDEEDPNDIYCVHPSGQGGGFPYGLHDQSW